MRPCYLPHITVLAMALTLPLDLRGDDAPQKPSPRGTVHLDGSIRIVGPDGKVQVRRFGGMPSDELTAKLKELQQAAGDREAVERISRELFELVAKESPRMHPRAMPEYGIGISLGAEVPPALRAQLKLPQEHGFLVQAIAPDSPADQAGLKEYDILLAVGDEPLTQASQLVAAVQQAGEQGRSVSLAIVSGGEHQVIEVQPAKSGELKWDVGDGLPGLPSGLKMEYPHRWSFAVPPGVTLGGAPGQPHFVPTPAFVDAHLNARIESLEVEVRKLRERLDSQK